MSYTVRDAFDEILRKRHAGYVAAYIATTDDGVELRYKASATCYDSVMYILDVTDVVGATPLYNPPTPASAPTVAPVVYTNLPSNHWLYQSHKTSRLVTTSGNGCNHILRRVGPVDKLVEETTFVDRTVGGIYGLTQTAPIAQGGLYQRVLLSDNQILDPTGRAKTLKRALRYYQLATYALAKKARNNAVGALLVGDDGSILAWGVNSGSHRHAEINLIRAYLTRPGSSATFPDKVTVFTSLTPCLQCTGALGERLPAERKVYFGQFDPGDAGQVGADNAFSQKLDTALGREDVNKQVVLGAKGPRDSEANEEIARVLRLIGIEAPPASEAELPGWYKVTTLLDHTTSNIRGSAAVALSYEHPTEVLNLAHKELVRKGSKTERKGTPLEHQLKQRIIEYLLTFLDDVDDETTAYEPRPGRAPVRQARQSLGGAGGGASGNGS